MAEYQLVAPPPGLEASAVQRTSDGAFIPFDEANKDYQEYQQWLADGGVPDPYIEPEPKPSNPTAEQELLFDHENRLRAIEGLAPLSKAEFLLEAGA